MVEWCSSLNKCFGRKKGKMERESEKEREKKKREREGMEGVRKKEETFQWKVWLSQWFSTCSPQTSNSNITWNF